MSNSIFTTGIGFCSGTTGYNIHTGQFFSALSEFLPMEIIDLHDNLPVNQNKIRSIQSSFKNNAYQHFVNLQISYGNQPFVNEIPGDMILYTVWESTRLPDDWLKHMRKAPEIWTPSQWGRQVMIDNGLDADKIHVIPEGVNTSIFNPDASPLSELSQFDGFKFLHVGKYENRKGTELLVRAFDEHFHNHDNVFLVMLVHNQFIKDFDTRRELEKLDLRAREKIIFLSQLPDLMHVASMMTACDAAVFPTRAEGWGLPIIESMACGLPTIVTNYSGPTEYVNNDNAYLLNYKMTDIDEPLFESNDGNYGQWAEPDSDHLINLMEEIILDSVKAKEKGRAAARDVHDHLQWKHAAKKACQLLLEKRVK